MNLDRVAEAAGVVVRVEAVVVRAEADVVQPAEDAAAHVPR
jgi:hypothetical protein